MAATSQGMMVVGRLVGGIGVGAASLLVPRYLSEIAPTRIRGLLGTFNQIFINLGIVSAFAIGWPLESVGPMTHVVLLGHEVLWWRCMFAAGLIPAVIQAIGMLFCPETPVWLLFSGLHLQATASYRALHGTNHEYNDNAPPPAAAHVHAVGSFENESPLLSNESSRDDVHDIQARTHSTPVVGLYSLFDRRYRLIMILALAIPLLQQFGGINTVILYGSDVFKTAGLHSPIAANLIMGCVNMGATCAAAVLMDRAGRKSLLTWSFAGMSLALGVMAAFLLLPTPAQLAGSVSFVGIMVYIIAFAMGCGPVPWVYLPEILPDEIKGTAQALCTAVNWLGNIAVGATFPTMMRSLGLGGSYALYAVFCCGGAVFCANWMVETKQRSLVDVHAGLLAVWR